MSMPVHYFLELAMSLLNLPLGNFSILLLSLADLEGVLQESQPLPLSENVIQHKSFWIILELQ